MKVVASGRKSHMFDAHLSVLYLDFLRVVFRQRRLELATDLGESMDNLGGALLWDAFSGNKQSALRCLRNQWSKDMRVTIVGPDSETPAPGGFSADGQPNDAWHQFLSSIKSAAERAALRVFRDPLKRDTLTQMPHSALGHNDGNVSLLTSLKAQLFAQISVPRSVLLWAWRSRLLITAEEQAALLAEELGQPVESIAERFLSDDRKKVGLHESSIRALCNFTSDDIPLHLDRSAWLTDMQPLEYGFMVVVEEPSRAPTRLPQWMQQHLLATLCSHRAQCAALERKLARCKPATKEALEKQLAALTRETGRTKLLMFDTRLEWPIYSLEGLSKDYRHHHVVAMQLDCGEPPRLHLPSNMVYTVTLRESRSDIVEIAENELVLQPALFEDASVMQSLLAVYSDSESGEELEGAEEAAPDVEEEEDVAAEAAADADSLDIDQSPEPESEAEEDTSEPDIDAAWVDELATMEAHARAGIAPACTTEEDAWKYMHFKVCLGCNPVPSCTFVRQIIEVYKKRKA